MRLRIELYQQNGKKVCVCMSENVRTYTYVAHVNAGRLNNRCKIRYKTMMIFKIEITLS